MKKQNFILQAVLILFFTILCLLIVFPFWLLVSASLSDSGVLAQSGYQVWPNPIDTSSYEYVFKNPLSEENIKAMRDNMSPEDVKAFDNFIDIAWR